MQTHIQAEKTTLKVAFQIQAKTRLTQAEKMKSNRPSLGSMIAADILSRLSCEQQGKGSSKRKYLGSSND